MIKYRIIKANDEALTIMWEENWELVSISDWKMYFKKKIIWTKSIKLDEVSPEYTEFIKAYRKINTNWSYDERLIAKYHKALEEVSHTDIMKNIEEYKLFLEVNKERPPLQVSSYINQKRYKDKWEIIKDVSRKWLNEIFQERWLNANEIEILNWEIKGWEDKWKKEIRRWVVYEMIKQIFKK